MELLYLGAKVLGYVAIPKEREEVQIEQGQKPKEGGSHYED